MSESRSVWMCSFVVGIAVRVQFPLSNELARTHTALFQLGEDGGLRSKTQMEIGPLFKMTLKTRLFLWLYNRFNNIAQWFIKHCDVEDKPFGLRR